MEEHDRIWLACAVDTEGSIHISKVREPRVRRGYQYLPRLSISNTHRGFLEHALGITGFGAVYVILETRNLLWKDKFEFKMNAKAMRIILPQIIPHLIIKRTLAEKMLMFLSLLPEQGDTGHKADYSSEVERLYAEIKILNKKGK